MYPSKKMSLKVFFGNENGYFWKRKKKDEYGIDGMGLRIGERDSAKTRLTRACSETEFTETQGEITPKNNTVCDSSTQ
jgi:hypothetical protein